MAVHLGVVSAKLRQAKRRVRGSAVMNARLSVRGQTGLSAVGNALRLQRSGFKTGNVHPHPQLKNTAAKRHAGGVTSFAGRVFPTIQATGLSNQLATFSPTSRRGRVTRPTG